MQSGHWLVVDTMRPHLSPGLLHSENVPLLESQFWIKALFLESYRENMPCSGKEEHVAGQNIGSLRMEFLSGELAISECGSKSLLGYGSLILQVGP